MADKFGLGSEIWDALRARTLNLPHDAGGNTIVGGDNFGLGNKIILYDSDGLDLRLYPTTQDGLIEALGDSTSGDTGWLPSVPIALTSGIFVPQKVALIGINRSQAALEFAGFSGTAITLAEDAYLADVSVHFVSNGATAIGVDARFAGARVFCPTVLVSGGSSQNIGVWIGQP